MLHLVLSETKIGSDLPAYPSDAGDLLRATPEAKGAQAPWNPLVSENNRSAKIHEDEQRGCGNSLHTESSRQFSLLGVRAVAQGSLRGGLIHTVQPVLLLESSCGY